MKLYLFFLIFSFSWLFAQTQTSLNIVTPQPFYGSEENSASFVIEAKKTLIDSIEIITDTNETIKIPIDANRSFYCKSIKLHVGENRVKVVGYKNAVAVKEEARELYLTSKVDKEHRYLPREYVKGYFHNDENEKLCVQCHDMSVNEVKGEAFVDVKKSNCYECHKNINTKKHAHAPSVNWLCTTCHNGEVGALNKADSAKTKYSVPDPIGDVCFSCHKKHKEEWGKNRFNHEPAESGRCNKCHNSHSEDNEMYLRKSSWDLCTTCHKDKIEGAHVVKTFGRAAHPTHGVKDPSRMPKELSCISCHSPHASNTSSLLHSQSVMGICSRCHKK